VTSARRKGAKLLFAANTAYVNTIPPGAQPPHPGNRKIEQHIRRYVAPG
jgi:pyruvate dehydrogenase E1 component